MHRKPTVVNGLVAVCLLTASACSSPSEPSAVGGSPEPTARMSRSPIASIPAVSDPVPVTSNASTSPTGAGTADPSDAPTQPTPVPTDHGLPAELLGVDLERLPGDSHVVALTFDAGANDAAVGSILDTLAAKDVPATFFVTGAWVRAYPKQSREIAARHPVGNHSVSHLDMTTLSDAEAQAEVVDAARAIQEVTGQEPRPWWRFPLGARDDRTIGLVNDLGYVSFRWTVDSLGWQGTSGGMSAEKVHERVLAGLQPGQIVLFHVGSHPDDGSMLDAAALPGIIDAIRAEGYGFVTLDGVIPHA